METLDFWALVATQLPALVGGFTALQTGLLHLGSSIKEERRVAAERLADKVLEIGTWKQLYADAVADRKSADQRLQFLGDLQKENVATLERAVSLTEKLYDRLDRPANAKTRATD